ncbi:MAG: VWA domain-containing protein [Planctomycetota bacterium]|jgi:Ca-activated chloride channel family protein
MVGVDLRETPSAADIGLELFGDLALGDPLFLSAIPVGLLFLLRGRLSSARPHLALAGLPGARPPRTLRQRVAVFVPWLQAVALVLMSVALARPLRTDVSSTDITEGVDILTVIDRSSSMNERDMEGGRTRLDVACEVVGDFAVRRMTDRVDAADSVGMLSFAAYPDLVCPITLDSDAFLDFLATVRPVQRNSAEDGTAIGLALAKAVTLLSESASESRVAVLLTDGVTTRREIEPLEAAELAADAGVVVYTIFVGPRERMGPFGRPIGEIDTSEIESVAELTGGRFYAARDREDLEGVYAEIEELEKTPRERIDEVETYDLYPPLLAGGLAAYLLAWVLGLTVGRRLL